jgi:hypothetical protein
LRADNRPTEWNDEWNEGKCLEGAGTGLIGLGIVLVVIGAIGVVHYRSANQ